MQSVGNLPEGLIVPERDEREEGGGREGRKERTNERGEVRTRRN